MDDWVSHGPYEQSKEHGGTFPCKMQLSTSKGCAVQCPASQESMLDKVHLIMSLSSQYRSAAHPKEEVGSWQEGRNDEPYSHKRPPTPLEGRRSLRLFWNQRGSRGHPICPSIRGRNSLQAYHISLHAKPVSPYRVALLHSLTDEDCSQLTIYA